MSIIIPDELVPKAGKNNDRYLNKLEPGETRKVLLLGTPLGAFKWWTKDDNGKPVPNLVPLDPKQVPDGVEVKMVWLAPGLDLADDRKKIWEIEPKTIQMPIAAISRDDDFDLEVCPVKVHREGATKDNTRYSVNALPPIVLTPEQEAEAATSCDPTALFVGSDTWDTENNPF